MPDVAISDIDGYHAARRRWPGVEIAAADFARHVAARVGVTHPADLYLACGCERGHPKAIAAFDAAFRREIEIALARLDLGAAERDEIAQRIRVRLFVAAGGAAPKIAEYTGRGRLAGWVRVVALRTGLNYLRDRRRLAEHPDLLAALPSPTRSADSEQVAARFRAELADALRSGFASLAPRQRNLLRQHFIDGATFKDLAGAYGVHRVTASIWLKEAQQALMIAVERLLTPRVGERVADVLGAIGSRLDVSLRAVMRTAPAA